MPRPVEVLADGRQILRLKGLGLLVNNAIFIQLNSKDFVGSREG